jgi:hypothetical protein
MFYPKDYAIKDYLYQLNIEIVSKQTKGNCLRTTKKSLMENMLT